MVSSHTAAAIAQTVFYAPSVPVALYIFIRNWDKGARVAWYPLVTFSLIRLVGGVIVIALSSNPNNIGLIISALVLLNVGVIPLIISAVGLIRLVLKSSFKDDSRGQRIIKVIRLAIIAAIALLVSSGSLGSSPSTADAGVALAKAGSILFAVILFMVIAIFVYLHSQEAQIVAGDRIYVRGALLAMPSLLLRTVYGLLYAFTSESIFSTWNPVFGSAVAFALMALLPEYVVFATYVYLGFHRIRDCSRQQPDADTEVMPKRRVGG